MKLKIINRIPRIFINTTLIHNGVKIERELYFPTRPLNFFSDVIFLLRSWFNIQNLNLYFEAGVFLSHLRVTKSSDRVLAIGIGTGSVMIPMVKLLNSGGGKYICLEASSSQIKIARKNLEINSIDEDNLEIINCFAGNQVYEVYGKSSEKHCNINDYDFDVLEMDCEGSEVSILKNLIKRPRNIIVELHPVHFTREYKDFETLIYFMDSIDYKYEFAYGHNGNLLEFNQAKKLYNNIQSFVHDYPIGSTPIVVTFTLKNN